MRWLADECVDAALVDHLRTAGHDVAYVIEVTPGESDLQAIDRAQREGRLLLTEDKDFGELVFRRMRLVPGLVLRRIAPERRSLKWTRLEAAINKLGESLYGRYTVIEQSRFRSRRLEP